MHPRFEERVRRLDARRRAATFGVWVAEQFRSAKGHDDDVLNTPRELEARRPALSPVVKYSNPIQESIMGIFTKAVKAAAGIAVISQEKPQSQYSAKFKLRIKIISLADEARAIRRDEARWINRKTGRRDHPARMSLMAHRKRDIRPEARCAQLAYGFLRGRKYSQLESKDSSVPNWLRIAELSAKYGPEGNRKLVYEHLKLWMET